MNGPDKAELKAFFRFIERRQRAWWRKEVKKKPAPWSKDPILQTAFFTNVYRELDPGTQYVLQMADDSTGLDPVDLTFWILFYRYTGSNWRDWREVDMLSDMVPTRKFKPVEVFKIFREMPNTWGNAYLVYPMTNEQTGKDKATLVIDAFGEIARVWPERHQAIVRAGHPQQSYQAIRSARVGIGPFTGYQAWVDYCMLGIIHDWRDTWVQPGPGAKRGASIIWGEDMNDKATAGACLWLHDKMADHFDWDKPYWLDHMPYVSDVQNCLCEYSKYVRVRETGVIKRKYQPA